MRTSRTGGGGGWGSCVGAGETRSSSYYYARLLRGRGICICVRADGYFTGTHLPICLSVCAWVGGGLSVRDEDADM